MTSLRQTCDSQMSNVLKYCKFKMILEGVNVTRLCQTCVIGMSHSSPILGSTEAKKKNILLLLLLSLLLLLLLTFYRMFRSRCYFVSTCSSSSLSLVTFPSVSILTLQWLSSPHILVQHGLSHDILQRLKKLKGFKADSDNPVL